MVEILLSAMNKMSGKVLKNMFQKKPADIFWGYVELLSTCFPPLLSLTVFLLPNAVKSWILIANHSHRLHVLRSYHIIYHC